MNIPSISFSFRRLALAQLGAASIAAILWGAGSLVSGYGKQIVLAGIAETAVLLATSVVFLVVFIPGKKRPVSTAATLWSAASFLRFLAALGASILLYYAAQYGARPLMFSFLLTAVLLLICETRVIAHDLTSINTLTQE